jgi:hypothetical protein
MIDLYKYISEGLLKGQDNTMQAGDEFDKIEKAKYKSICKELKKFLKICESSKNFKKWPVYTQWDYISAGPKRLYNLILYVCPSASQMRLSIENKNNSWIATFSFKDFTNTYLTSVIPCDSDDIDSTLKFLRNTMNTPEKFKSQLIKYKQ